MCIRDSYNADAVITVNTVFSAHHYGHITVSGCPMGRASTQACFDAFPLEFVQDNLTQMPPDPQHKDRGMMHALDMELSMDFKLPPGLVGEEVLLQWVYTTANSCAPVGYRTYFETQNPPDGSSSWKSNLPDCKLQNLKQTRKSALVLIYCILLLFDFVLTYSHYCCFIFVIVQVWRTSR